MSPGSVRSIDEPLAWAGSDRILLNDRTTTGLRRMVIASKEGIPNQVSWLETAFRQAERSPSPPTPLPEGEGRRVHWWLVERSDGVYLWMVWKEG